MKASSNQVDHATSGRRLSEKIEAKHELNRLCAEAIHQQIERGEAQATHLRNRRRHLARQLLKRIPHAGGMTPRKLMHAAAMVLAMWGFGGIGIPQQAGAAPLFKHTTLAGFDVGQGSAPTFADIDGDGDLDAFVGDNYGTVKFYRNNGTVAAAAFVADAAGNPMAGFDVGSYAAPAFADIDNDGDLDAFAGDGTGMVQFFRNFDPTAGALAVSLDVDGSGVSDASDGVMILRKLNGGQTVITGIVLPAGASNASVVNAIVNAGAGFDVDGDGDADANDGVMILRRLNGGQTVITGVALPAGAGGAGVNGARTNAEIIGVIDGLK